MIAITGWRGRPAPQPALRGLEEQVIDNALAELDTTTLVVGGARGGDTAAARLGRHHGHRIHLVVPTAYYDHESHRYAHDMEVAPAGLDRADSYRQRNKRLIELADEWVIAFPRTAVEELRSGTWMTVRLARAAGKHVDIHPLDALGLHLVK